MLPLRGWATVTRGAEAVTFDGRTSLFAGPTDFVYSVSANRDETIAIAGGEDGVLRVWNAQNAQELFKFEPPKPPGTDTAQASAK